jgi:hypothetical protein
MEVAEVGVKHGVKVVVEAEGFLKIPAYNRFLVDPDK